jgi:hypothetical protein
MRRAVILATLTLLLLTFAGITVARESNFGPDVSYRTEPTSREATTRESTDLADEEPTAENEVAGAGVVENSVEPESYSSEVVEDQGAWGEGKSEKRGRPKDVGKPEHAGGRAGVAREGKPEGVGGGRAGQPPDESEAKGDGEKAARGGSGRKVTICHKGKISIMVGAPAEAAHLRHGDSPGECGR